MQPDGRGAAVIEASWPSANQSVWRNDADGARASQIEGAVQNLFDAAKSYATRYANSAGSADVAAYARVVARWLETTGSRKVAELKRRARAADQFVRERMAASVKGADDWRRLAVEGGPEFDRVERTLSWAENVILVLEAAFDSFLSGSELAVSDNSRALASMRPMYGSHDDDQWRLVDDAKASMKSAAMPLAA